MNVIFSMLVEKQLSRPEKRKLQILEAAIELTASEGLEALTFEKIAARCSVTRPLIHHYFSSKDELLDLMATYVTMKFQKHIIEHLEKAQDPLQLLINYCRANVDLFEREPADAKILLFFFARCGVDAKFKKKNTEMVDMGFNRIRGILQDGKAKGVFQVNDVESASRLIQYLLTSVVFSAATEERSSEERAQARALVERQILDLVLRPDFDEGHRKND